MALNRSATWYYGADGQVHQAVNNGDGWEFSMASGGDDGLNVRLVDDPALIQNRIVELLGYNPDDRQVNQNGSREVQIRNPMTGQFETGVITANGLEMPLSLAQARGEQIISYLKDPIGIGGSPFSQVKEMWDEGALKVVALPFAVGAMAGAGAAGGEALVGGAEGALGGASGSGFADGLSYSISDFAAPTSVASSTAFAGGAEGGASLAEGGGMDGFFGDLIGGAESSWMDPAFADGISSGLSGPGALEANAALGLGSGSVLGDYFPPSMWEQLKGILSPSDIAKLGANGLKSLATGGLGRSILDQITGDPLGAAFNSTPFLLALAEANRQGKDVDSILSKFQGLADETGNIDSAVLNPYDRETALGRGRLTQSLSDRGVLGSSFGNADLFNYDTTRDTGRGDLLAKTRLGTTALKGDLYGKILQGQTQKTTNRNMLLGAGLSASGNLFKPVQDPFQTKLLEMMGGVR